MNIYTQNDYTQKNGFGKDFLEVAQVILNSSKKRMHDNLQYILRHSIYLQYTNLEYAQVS